VLDQSHLIVNFGLPRLMGQTKGKINEYFY